MIFSFDNTAIKALITEKASITELVPAGSAVTVKLDDNNNFSDNDFVLLGELMNPKTEIAQIDGAVTAGHNITVDTVVFAHAPYTPVYKLPYNQVKLYNSATVGGAKTLLETKNIDVDQRYTDFTIADSMTGYLYFTLYNSETSTESSYSPAFSATEDSDVTLSNVKRKVEMYYPEGVENEKFMDLVDIVVEQIYSEKKWGFREKTATFTTTSGTTEYSIEDDIGITDFGTLISARTDDDILTVVSNDDEDVASLSATSLIYNTISQWGDKLNIRVHGAKNITIKYLKTPPSLTNMGSTVDSKIVTALVYGILSELYLTEDVDLSDRFALKYQIQIKKMKKLDQKDIEMPILTGVQNIENKLVTPTIT